MICPNCGNVWNVKDPDNRAAAAARQRMPIITVEVIAHELDEKVMRIRCTACSAETFGSFKKGRLIPDK